MVDVSQFPDCATAVAHVRSLPDSPEVYALEDAIRQRWPEALYPQRGMQHAVASSTASIVFLGGAASSGKTWLVLWWPTQFLGVKNYNCTYVRRDKEEMRASGGLWDEGSLLWGNFPGVHLRRQELEAQRPRKRPTWKIKLTHIHLETPAALEKKKGTQTCDLVIEEATGFKEESVVYMMSRNRPMGGCLKPAQTLLTTNPDRDSWVFNWVRPWCDPESPLHGIQNGEHLHLRRWEMPDIPAEMVPHVLHRDGALCWLAPTYNDWAMENNKPKAKTVTYIEGSVYENRALLATEGGQDNLANLESQDYIQRERLLHSNWLIRDTDTHTFQRDWFTILAEAPPVTTIVRSWDYSVRRKYTRSRTKPDYTVGVKVGRLRQTKDGRPCYIILDMWRQRCTPSEAEDATAEVAKADGKKVALLQQTTHGDEGIRAVNMTRRFVVPGYTVHGIQLKGDKEERAFAFSAAAQQGRVYLLKAPWNADFLTECANFPNGRYDDQVDATSVAITHLKSGAVSSAAPPPPVKRPLQW